MTTYATIGFCCAMLLIASFALDTGSVRSLGLASVDREGPPQMLSSFSSVAQNRQTRSGNNPVEQSYDSVGGDNGDDNNDDDDLAYTEDNNSKEEREDQLDQDDPGNFRDSIYDSFQTRDCMRYRVVC